MENNNMFIMEKLALKDRFDDYAKEIIEENRKKYGKVTAPFLMRKLKCTYSKACELLEEETSDNVCNVVNEK